MVTDLFRAGAMLSDSAVRRTFLLAIGATLLLLAAMFPTTSWLIEQAGSTGYVWIDRILEVLGLAGTALISWFLFPVIVAATLGFLLDGVVAATERRHMPALPPARGLPLSATLVYSLLFGLLVLVLNVLVLPLYLVPGLNIPVFLALNSYLIGREYVELVLARRHGLHGLGKLRRAYRLQLWLSGLVTSLILLVPFVNLLAPIVGSAFATLRIHRARLRQTQKFAANEPLSGI
jgi:uncharacterized protein involved in cysteine biosynthesis